MQHSTPLDLARRLERAEGHAGSRFVEARARLAPDSGTCWTEIAGAYAMFDGPDSPLTQTFGLGIFHLPTAADMDRLEAFFHNRGAATAHEVSPLAGNSILAILHDRGYRPLEFTNVMYLPLNNDTPMPESDVTVKLAETEHDRDIWVRTAAEGWREVAEFVPIISDLMRVSASRDDFHCFLAELDGLPIAAGSLAIHDGVALLSGSSTIPECRRRGAQRAMSAHRLDYAARAGCDIAMICSQPGSTTQRNAERDGFQVAYTRIKWVRSAIK